MRMRSTTCQCFHLYSKSRKQLSARLANSESVGRVCASLRPLEEFQDPVQSEESVHPDYDGTEQGLAPIATFLQPDVGDVCGQNAGKYFNI